MNENNNTRKEQQEDDGSLSFLAIPQDEGNKHFNCRETTQQKLINLTFWVCDFIEGVKTIRRGTLLSEDKEEPG